MEGFLLFMFSRKVSWFQLLVECFVCTIWAIVVSNGSGFEIMLT
jgi:hypothetical protein